MRVKHAQGAPTFRKIVRATPVHTIVRYRPRPIAFYATWQPVQVMRFRLFVSATHEEVTGDRRGAPWDHDWSCETLDSGMWRINGRNQWSTIEEAESAAAEGTFATFAEALSEARAMAMRAHDRAQAEILEIRWNLGEIQKATAPVLP